jgi:hypothetical protein
MVLLASSYDQSRFFRAEDLPEEKTLKIKNVTEEMIGQGADQGHKLVVWFTNSQKGLVLNKTNNRTIRGAYGDDVANWAGKLIVLFPTKAPFRGTLVGAVRVRIPLKKNPNITTDTSSIAAATKPTSATKPEPIVEDLGPEDLDSAEEAEEAKHHPDFDDKVDF